MPRTITVVLGPPGREYMSTITLPDPAPMSQQEREARGLEPYRYRVRYWINGAKFQRYYRTQVAADTRAAVLVMNGITVSVKRVNRNYP